MFTVVVFEKKTRKVILCMPLRFENDANVTQEDSILHNDYDYEVFANRQPLFFEDADGDICLRENIFIVDSGDWL